MTGSTLPSTRFAAYLALFLALLFAFLLCCSATGQSPCVKVMKYIDELEMKDKEHIACVRIFPKREPEFHFIFGDPGTTYSVYLELAKDFARDVSGVSSESTNQLLQHGGEAIMIITDNATLPDSVLRNLLHARIPLLTHALLKSVETDSVVYIPDFHFIMSKGFKELEAQLLSRNVSVAVKEPVVFWRGSSTGSPCAHSSIALLNDSGVEDVCIGSCSGLQRVQAAIKAREVPWLDVQIVNAVQSCSGEDDVIFLKEQGILGQNLDEISWSDHRGILEIDGNVNAWGQRWRMVAGSVLFRVETQYMNAYNQCQRPWIHYVPIFADLSDLVSVTSIVASEDKGVIAELENISRRSAELSSHFTYEKELERVTRELDFIWSYHGHSFDLYRFRKKCPETAATLPLGGLLK